MAHRSITTPRVRLYRFPLLLHRFFLLLFFLLLCLLVSHRCWSDPPRIPSERLRVGMPQPGVVPFFWQDEQGTFRGIYADTLSMIAERLNLELEFLPLSQARLVRQFEQGALDIEAGVLAVYTDTADSPVDQVSLFSRPFGMINHVIIYRPELSFPVFILNDLKEIRVATVRGSHVPEQLLREEFANPWQIAQRVHRGWNDIGLMTEATALYYQRSQQLNYRISLPYASDPVSFRLHRQKSALLEPINRTIRQLDREGWLEQIVCRYLCGHPSDPIPSTTEE